MREYKRKYKYNKVYKGSHTKRELNKRINIAWTMIVILLSISVFQQFTLTSNEMTIFAVEKIEEELPPPGLKPLAIIIDTPEIKELAVKPKIARDLSSEKQEVKDYIIAETTKQGLDTDLYLKIAFCESGYNPYAKSRISTASGTFQFINSTWRYVNAKRGLDWTLDDRFDYKKNIDNAIWLLENEGATHWECYNIKGMI